MLMHSRLNQNEDDRLKEFKYRGSTLQDTEGAYSEGGRRIAARLSALKRVTGNL